MGGTPEDGCAAGAGKNADGTEGTTWTLVATAIGDCAADCPPIAGALPKTGTSDLQNRSQPAGISSPTIHGPALVTLTWPGAIPRSVKLHACTTPTNSAKSQTASAKPVTVLLSLGCDLNTPLRPVHGAQFSPHVGAAALIHINGDAAGTGFGGMPVTLCSSPVSVLVPWSMIGSWPATARYDAMPDRDRACPPRWPLTGGPTPLSGSP